MEIFLPSLLIILLAAVVTFVILPRFSPYVLTILSIVLLVFGVYHHYGLFKDEYRLATWYQNTSFLAPALVLGVALFFILGYIMTFFGSSGVPVPAVPTEITGAFNTMKTAVGNVTSRVTDAANSAINTVNQSVNRGLNNGIRFNNSRSRNNSLANKLP